MKRRNFLFGFGAIAASVGLLKSVSSAYQPIGYVHATYPTARDIETITVDGREVRHVFELDDVEGWVRHYTFFETRVPQIERLTGEVRVKYRSPQG